MLLSRAILNTVNIEREQSCLICSCSNATRPSTQNEINIVPSATTSKEDNWYGVDLNDLFNGHRP